jgi:hypothetical protein
MTAQRCKSDSGAVEEQDYHRRTLGSTKSGSAALVIAVKILPAQRQVVRPGSTSQYR